MQYRVYRVFYIVLTVLSVASCNLLTNKEGDQIIAECYGNYLYKADLKGLIFPGTLANDSVAVTKQFIDNWIRQQIMLHLAENNLTEDQKDFKQQIESYRNSLIIYAYESELIKQKLDTAVTMDQIEEFYNLNQQNFQLRENIIKVKYVKIPEASAKDDLIKKVTKFLKSGDSDDTEKLIELCQASMLQCNIEDENWIRFEDLRREVPINTDDQEEFLNSRSFYETSDSLFVYLVKFSDFKIKEAVSPLSFEINNIRALILNRRKIELMNRMQQEVYHEAMENKGFTIY
jgi:hypothetical protein